MGYFGASKMEGASWFWVSGPGLLSIQNVACQMTHFKRLNASNLWGRNANWLLSGPVSRWCCLHREQNWGRKLSKMVKWGESAHKLAGGRPGVPRVEIFQGALNGSLTGQIHITIKVQTVEKLWGQKCAEPTSTEVLFHLRGWITDRISALTKKRTLTLLIHGPKWWKPTLPKREERKGWMLR